MSLLLGTDPSRLKLNELLTKNKKGVLLTAFFSNKAGDWLEDFNLESSTFVIRGQYLDFTSGSTSLPAIKKLIDKGHTVKLKLDLHAKLFWFGDEMLIGSSNLTGNGFNLIEGGGNIELNSVVPATDDNITLVNNIVEKSFDLNNELLLKMDELLADTSSLRGDIESDWPSDLFLEACTALSVSDLPSLTIYECANHDLGVWGDISRKHLSGNLDGGRKTLEKTKIYNWLVSKIEEAGERGINFGKFSNLLHNELSSDPEIFRVEVKNLQVNLYSFLKEIPSGLSLSVPGSKSEVLKLR